MTVLDHFSTQQKSVILAKIIGWRVRDIITNPIESGIIGREKPKYGTVIYYDDEHGYLHETGDFYDPQEPMDIAWMILNWAAQQSQVELSDYSFPYILPEAVDMLFAWSDLTPWRLPPAQAKSLLLDRILELALEAGLAEEVPIT